MGLIGRIYVLQTSCRLTLSAVWQQHIVAVGIRVPSYTPTKLEHSSYLLRPPREGLPAVKDVASLRHPPGDDYPHLLGGDEPKMERP